LSVFKKVTHKVHQPTWLISDEILSASGLSRFIQDQVRIVSCINFKFLLVGHAHIRGELQ